MRPPLLLQCSQPWDALPAQGTRRHCAACACDVHDLSAMTQADALALLRRAASEGLCVSVALDGAGDMIHLDDAEGSRGRGALRRVNPAAAQLGAGVLAVALGTGSGCVTPAREQRTDSPPIAAVVDASPAAVPANVATTATDERPRTQGSATAPTAARPLYSDGDGVADADDRCPYEPGPAFQYGAATAGCPRKTGIVVVQREIEILTRLYFEFAQHDLLPTVRPLVDEVAQVLVARPDLAQIEVLGHATPDEPRPKWLSEKRAQAVAAALRQEGIAADRLRVAGRGADQPLAPNTTRENRNGNRRVEFAIVRRASCDTPGSTTR